MKKLVIINIWFYLALWICINCNISLRAQTKNILFYNVENIFDTINDKQKDDEEFLPQGDRHWTTYKYYHKLSHIAQVIFESGGFNLPILIGLAEVENNKVLKDLIFSTGLNNAHYFPIHFESPDKRGIDVALLYKKDVFKVYSAEAIPVIYKATSRPTRDILHVFGFIKNHIALHIYINHWPSRYGGLTQTREKRIRAAEVLANAINKVLKKDANANIVVMGDFNDNPDNESIKRLINSAPLINLTTTNKGQGSLKYKHEWYSFDQMLISKNLRHYAKFKIIDFSYLLEEDTVYSGYKPNRTYIGYRYHGGYSDHLPIMLHLHF